MLSNNILVALSWIAHLVVALILCDQEPSVVKRIILLVSIGLIAGIQNICIKKIFPPKCLDDKQTNPDP